MAEPFERLLVTDKERGFGEVGRISTCLVCEREGGAGNVGGSRGDGCGSDDLWFHEAFSQSGGS